MMRQLIVEKPLLSADTLPVHLSSLPCILGCFAIAISAVMLNSARKGFFRCVEYVQVNWYNWYRYQLCVPVDRVQLCEVLVPPDGSNCVRYWYWYHLTGLVVCDTLLHSSCSAVVKDLPPPLPSVNSYYSPHYLCHLAGFSMEHFLKNYKSTI